MQTVSQSWKNAHKQTLLNESFVEVSLDIADPESIADASANDNGAVYISDTSKVVKMSDSEAIPYNTLEQNVWLLDGNRKAIPVDDNKDGGYVGDVLSNDEGFFVDKTPTITINFTRVFEKIIPGITIFWGTAYNEFATDFVVTAYNGDAVVARKEVANNKAVISAVEMDIVNYDRITIQVVRWCLPDHRARVDEVFIGWHKVYSKSNLLSYSHTQSIDPVSTSLPKMEIKFSIDNSDNSYNPYNLSGLAKYLTERQEVVARYGLKVNGNTVEWIKGGSFYLSEWYAKQNGISAEFVARDLLGFMSAEYNDEMWNGSERSLYEIALQVLNKAELPLNSDGSVKWVIDTSLKTFYTKARLPLDTMANCLQMIANAGRCVLYPNRDSILHIAPINNEPTDYKIDYFRSYSRPEITLSKPLKAVAVKVYQYVMGDDGVESSTTDVVIPIADEGEVITIDNPLITDGGNASSLGEWVGNYLKNRMTLTSEERADVRLDALDIVENKNDYGKNNVRMTNVEFTFNGAFRCTGEGRVI